MKVRTWMWLSLFLIPLALYLYAYFRTPLIPMIDGPYYASQLLWIAKYGTLRHPDPPLTFYLLLPFYWLTGDNILAVKIGAPFLVSLAFLPAFLFLREVEEFEGAAAAGALAFTLSEYTVRMVTDFVKNAVGLIWIFSWMLFSYRYQKNGNWRDLVGAVASVMLAMLTHILDFGFIVAVSIVQLFMKRDKRSTLLAAFSLAFLALAFFQPWIVGGDIFKGIAFVEEVSEGETGRVRASAPVRMTDLIPYAASLLLVVVWLKGGEALYGAVGIVSLLMNIPFYGWKWIMRFRNMTGIPLGTSLGNAHSLAGRKGFYLSILALALISSSGLQLASSVHPTIDLETYEEMRYIFSRFTGEVYVPDVKVRYWAETISLSVGSSPQGADYLMICLTSKALGGGQIPPPQDQRIVKLLRHLRAIPLFEGRRCFLYKIGG